MQAFLQSYKVQSVTFLFIYLVSMILSAEFILSLSMIALVLLALFQLKIDGQRVTLHFRDTLRADFQNYWGNKAWLVVSIPFFLTFLSAAYSDDWTYTLERLRIKLPFLVLPFAFAAMPKLKKQQYFAILFFLLIMMFISCLYIGANYLVHFGEINELIGKGRPIPTPSNHIRFSLTLALTIIGGIALWWDGFYFQSQRERHFIGGITLFLFVFIHVLAVRSGLFALYLALLAIGIQRAVVSKKHWMGFIVVASLILLPILAYKMIPSFQAKISYAGWDFRQYLQGIGGNYSDSERLASLQVGLKIGNEHPFLGVGAGDLKQEVEKVYATEFGGDYTFRMPHNQFISVYAGTGLIGLSAFVFGFFFPLFYRENYRNSLFLALHAIIFISFMMENTIENNFGVSLYLLFLLMGLNYLQDFRNKTSDKVLP